MEEGKKPHLNPLGIPWGRKPRVGPKEPVLSYLGLRNEAARDNARTGKFITVTVQGLKGAPGGEYKLQWEEGAILKQYLSQLKLVVVAARAAVRDLTNPGAGRLRLHYVPEAGAKITLGSPSLSSALQYQRSAHDAEDVARRMNGGARYADVPLPKR